MRSSIDGALDNLPLIHEDPDIWRKIGTVPAHLQFILAPTCNLWDFQVYKHLLCEVLQHFEPALFVSQRTSKAELVRLFYDHVVAEYGVFFGL